MDYRRLKADENSRLSLSWMLNVVLFGKTAKQWKDENMNAKGNMREMASLKQVIYVFILQGGTLWNIYWMQRR